MKSTGLYTPFNNNKKSVIKHATMNSIQNGYHIYAIKNIKTSDPHRPILDLSDKINIKRSDKYVALSNLSIYYASTMI